MTTKGAHAIPYLFPVPAAPLRSLLDAKAQGSAKFSEEEATLDVMLAMDRDDLKPSRYLAARWGWSHSTTYRKLEALKAEAVEWRAFNKAKRQSKALKQAETELEQRETEIKAYAIKMSALETRLEQRETELEQYRTDPDNKPRPSGSARAPEAGKGKGPTMEQVLARAAASGVPEDQAHAFFYHYDANGWTTGGERPRPVGKWESALMKWHHKERGSERARASKGASRSVRALRFNPSETVPDSDLAAVLSTVPGLSREHFAAYGRDHRTGESLWRLRSEHKHLVTA